MHPRPKGDPSPASSTQSRPALSALSRTTSSSEPSPSFGLRLPRLRAAVIVSTCCCCCAAHPVHKAQGLGCPGAGPDEVLSPIEGLEGDIAALGVLKDEQKPLFLPPSHYTGVGPPSPSIPTLSSMSQPPTLPTQTPPTPMLALQPLLCFAALAEPELLLGVIGPTRVCLFLQSCAAPLTTPHPGGLTTCLCSYGKKQGQPPPRSREGHTRAWEQLPVSPSQQGPLM